MTLYQRIAARISERIDQGVYPPGTRLPGVRRLSEQFDVSISTIVQAQRQLENNGLIEARPRSGYYVNLQPWRKPALPASSRPEIRPTPVSGQELVLQLARLANQPDFIQLGAAVPDPDFMPLRALQRSLARVARRYDQRAANYAFPPGLPELRQQIARRQHLCGDAVDSERILITSGCQEALSLALQTVARAGDIVAIESPTFYGLLQVIESLGMKALEIPTSPQTGIKLGALELALEQWPVKACVLTPNFSNPLGSLMPDTAKQALLGLAARHELVLIEDDINGDIGFGGLRPRSLHGFAADGDNGDASVIYCSSFSKTVSQGLRVGWMVLPERHFQRAEYLKYVTNLAAPTLSQLALVDFLAEGGYERHLRHARARYAAQIERFSHAISKYFPTATRVTRPQGGFVLWLELDANIDALRLSHRLLEHRVSIAPGQIFSASQKYRNCIRLNCALPWSARLEKALLLLGREVGAAAG